MTPATSVKGRECIIIIPSPIEVHRLPSAAGMMEVERITIEIRNSRGDHLFTAKSLPFGGNFAEAKIENLNCFFRLDIWEDSELYAKGLFVITLGVFDLEPGGAECDSNG